MKKTVLKIITIFSFFFLGSVSAKTIEVNSRTIKDLEIYHENDVMAMKFTLASDFDARDPLKNNFGLFVYEKNLGENGEEGADREHTYFLEQFKIVNADAVVNENEVEGTPIPQNQIINAGTTLYVYQKGITNLRFAEFEMGDGILTNPDSVNRITYDHHMRFVFDFEKEQMTYAFDKTLHDEFMAAFHEKYDNHLELTAISETVHGLSIDFSNSEEFHDDMNIGHFHECTDEEDLPENTPVVQKNPDQILKDIEKIIKNIKLEDNYYVEEGAKESLFHFLKTFGSSITFEQKEKEVVLYRWTFDGTKLESTDFNIDLNLKLNQSENQDKILALVPKKEESIVLTFNYHGELPKGTRVEVNASTYQNGDLLTLYYYNEDGKLEEIARDLEVKKDYVSFDLAHCSDYVLVKQEKKTNNAQTGTLDTFFFGTLACLSLGGIYFLGRKRKTA